MRKQTKRYELNSEVSIEKLKEVGFKKGGILGDISTENYCYIKYLIEEIDLLVEVEKTEDNTIIFNDEDNVLVIDEDFGQPYGSFYNEEKDTPFINEVIKRYNKEMDKLVDKGILKEKKVKEKETPKAYKKIKDIN